MQVAKIFWWVNRVYPPGFHLKVTNRGVKLFSVYRTQKKCVRERKIPSQKQYMIYLLSLHIWDLHENFSQTTHFQNYRGFGLDYSPLKSADFQNRQYSADPPPKFQNGAAQEAKNVTCQVFHFSPRHISIPNLNKFWGGSADTIWWSSWHIWPSKTSYWRYAGSRLVSLVAVGVINQQNQNLKGTVPSFQNLKAYIWWNNSQSTQTIRACKVCCAPVKRYDAHHMRAMIEKLFKGILRDVKAK